MSKRSIVPTGAIRFCLGALVVLGFLVALFCAGLAIYADRTGISFAQAWDKLWNIGKAAPQIEQAVTYLCARFA